MEVGFIPDRIWILGSWRNCHDRLSQPRTSRFGLVGVSHFIAVTSGMLFISFRTNYDNFGNYAYEKLIFVKYGFKE